MAKQDKKENKDKVLDDNPAAEKKDESDSNADAIALLESKLSLAKDQVDGLEKSLKEKADRATKLAEDLNYYKFHTTQQVTKLTETIENKTDDISSLHNDLSYYKSRTTDLDIINFEMRTLLKAGKGFSDILNLHSLLETFSAVVREKFSINTSAILLHESGEAETSPSYIVCNVHNLPEMVNIGSEETPHEISIYTLKLPREDGLLWQSIQQGEVISVRDLQNKARFRDSFDKNHLDLLDADVWCPIIKKGDVLGILTLGRKSDETMGGDNKSHKNMIKEAEYQYIQDLASIVATNIDSTLKFEKNQSILRNIRILYNTNQELSNVQDFKELTRETIRKATEVCHAQFGSMMLLNEDSNELEISVVWGDLPERIRDDINNGRSTVPKRFATGEAEATECFQTGTSMRTNDKGKISQVKKQPIYALLTVPMKRDNEVIGMITMTNKAIYDENGEPVFDDHGNLKLQPLGRFSEEDEQLLQGLADQAAGNLQRSRFYSDSITDRLTGLKNKRHFDEEIEDLVINSQGYGDEFAVIITDIDHFKKFNDTYGHEAGNQVLVETASILRKMESNTHVQTGKAFRYGGEEFVLLIKNCSLERARTVAENYRTCIEKARVAYEGKELKVTVSIGVSMFPQDGRTPKELFNEADRSLYVCKEQGRNQVRFLDPDSRERLRNSEVIADHVTKLYSQRHFKEVINNLDNGNLRDSDKFALLICDIDQIKELNKKHSRELGNQILKDATNELVKLIRADRVPPDNAYRYAGTKTALLLEGSDLAEALTIADEYRRNIELLKIMFEGKEHRITVSIGVASYYQNGKMTKEIINIADRCLEASTRLGGNTVRFRDPDSRELLSFPNDLPESKYRSRDELAPKSVEEKEPKVDEEQEEEDVELSA